MSNPNNVGSLFAQAAEKGGISTVSAGTLARIDVANAVQVGLGLPPDAFPGSEAFFCGVLLDDSGSILEIADGEKSVRSGHNAVLDALGGSQQKEGILVHAATLNRGCVYPFTPLLDAPKLDGTNYQARGGTPLYDLTIVMLGTVLAKQREYANAGVPCRAAVLIVTDGHDEHSRRKAKDVVPLIDDLLRGSESNVVAFMGINDGTTDFHAVAKAMGVRDEWIMTPSKDPKEIRRAFQVFSRASLASSQGAQLSQGASVGGFGWTP